jgi:S-adenosylmethionine:tRNA ribosyltransferase-isomerase
MRAVTRTIDEFEYVLPPELIAQHPAAERSGSRLLRLDAAGLHDSAFRELPAFLREGDVLVFNDTKVIKARLHGERDSGGRVEVLIDRIDSPQMARARLRASHAPKAGGRLLLAGALDVEVLAREGEIYTLRLHGATWHAALERYGATPLPPYIERPPDEADAARYQTVYASSPGAVAAPTAGLHFDEDLLARLRDRGVVCACLTLHVGAGTFQPVRVRDIDEHRMHAESYDIPPATLQALAAARARGGTVVAVGTTSLRALEAHALHGAPRGDTDLFIRPGFRFGVVDRLITNFHLPRSTLLMLVAAFAGMDAIRRAYLHAVAERYRFFSYGDAMLIDRMDAAGR